MKKSLFSIVLLVIAMLVVVNAPAQELDIHEIKNLKNISIPIDGDMAKSITGIEPKNTDQAAGFIVIPPSDAGSPKSIRFVRTRLLPAGSIIVPTIVFPSSSSKTSTWIFQGFQLNSDINPVSTFQIITIGDFGQFWEEGAFVQLFVKLPTGETELAQAVIRAYRSPIIPSPVTSVRYPTAKSIRRVTINGDSRVILEGDFDKEQSLEIFWGYFALDPEAIVEIARNRIVINPKKVIGINDYNGTYVVTVRQGNISSSMLFQNE